ncbi:hypothetical protein [Deminuibacter soli]|uniref:Uncharacterized protein n=1 Tax=Deminuibacter soli TaxID=2291815 RepID=A0A3E1NE47_9BACT|nr:hypothetical protein [Deminuibacter soli]RFM26243.1 hypothetical protein DXN05_20230 [Deminuibacter soli]
MQIDHYLKSGIVEAYVNGSATPEQAAEFEQLLPEHAQLQQALEQCMARFGKLAWADEHRLVHKPGMFNKTAPLPGTYHAVTEDEADTGSREDSDFVAATVSSPTIRVHKYWRGVFIAVFFLSKLFLGLFIYYLVQYQSAVKEIKRLEQQVSTQAAPVAR